MTPRFKLVSEQRGRTRQSSRQYRSVYHAAGRIYSICELKEQGLVSVKKFPALDQYYLSYRGLPLVPATRNQCWYSNVSLENYAAAVLHMTRIHNSDSILW